MNRRSFVYYAYPVFLAFFVLLLWEVSTVAFAFPVYLLPAPTAILASLMEDWRLIWINLFPTMIEILLGYALSIIVGIPLATAIVYSRWAERTLYPPMVASQAIPKVAIAPLFIVWMGYGVMPKVAIAFLIAFFPIVIDTVVGLRSISPDMVHLGRSMGGGRYLIFLKLRLPNALPNIFGGLKVAITLAVVGAITGEFVGSQEGLGYLLTSASGKMETPLVFAVLLVISAVAMILFVLVEAAERIIIPWHTSMRSRRASDH